MEEKTGAYIATGRRKESIARVRLSPGKGIITVNERPLEEFFSRETDRLLIKQPLELTGNLNKFDIFSRVNGGGSSGQAGALRLGISRALSQIDPATRSTLKKQGCLSRDPRMKERKKYGQKGARKRLQWTKR